MAVAALQQPVREQAASSHPAPHLRNRCVRLSLPLSFLPLSSPASSLPFPLPFYPLVEPQLTSSLTQTRPRSAPCSPPCRCRSSPTTFSTPVRPPLLLALARSLPFLLGASLTLSSVRRHDVDGVLGPPRPCLYHLRCLPRSAVPCNRPYASPPLGSSTDAIFRTSEESAERESARARGRSFRSARRPRELHLLFRPHLCSRSDSEHLSLAAPARLALRAAAQPPTPRPRRTSSSSPPRRHPRSSQPSPASPTQSQRIRPATMASFFNFGNPIEVDVRLAGEDERQSVEVKGDHGGKGAKSDALAGRERCPVFLDGESVRGQVRSRSLCC